VKLAPAKTKHAELSAELFKLRTQHVAALARALFGGFTPEEEAAHEKRVERMAVLVRELQALDETSEVAASFARRW
jgi:hypothetical protein